MAITAKWRQHIEAWQRSGLSQAAYCVEQQPNVCTFEARLSDYHKLLLMPADGWFGKSSSSFEELGKLVGQYAFACTTEKALIESLILDVSHPLA